MIIATTLRYTEIMSDPDWKDRYYIVDFFRKMAEKYGVGLISVMNATDIDKVSDMCDGLIIPGSATNIDPSYYGMSPFNPPQPVDEFALDSKLIEAFYKKKKPILGICGGHQAINVFFGGTLKRVDNSDGHYLDGDVTHKINIKQGSFVYDVFQKDEASVNSYHFWEIDRLGYNLKAVAYSSDQVIEAVENKEDKIFATQWHPERSFSVGNPIENKIFENFFELCRK